MPLLDTVLVNAESGAGIVYYILPVTTTLRFGDMELCDLRFHDQGSLRGNAVFYYVVFYKVICRLQ